MRILLVSTFFSARSSVIPTAAAAAKATATAAAAALPTERGDSNSYEYPSVKGQQERKTNGAFSPKALSLTHSVLALSNETR